VAPGRLAKNFASLPGAAALSIRALIEDIKSPPKHLKRLTIRQAGRTILLPAELRHECRSGELGKNEERREI